MQVETFEVQEVTTSGKPEDCAEALRLIEELGLEGQQSRNQDGKVCPYRKMTKDEAFVYGVLCSQKTPLNKYSDEPIPLRVLQVAAHAKTQFGALEVWHPENADIKDPVLVGVNGSPYSTQERFILARWGEVLDSFEVLKKRAIETWRSKVEASIVEARAKLESDLASLRANPLSVLHLKQAEYHETTRRF